MSSGEMIVQVLGCSHHHAALAVRERLAFSPDQVRSALGGLRQEFPQAESVLLSTCNRVELYTAAENGAAPSHQQIAQFLARFHHLDPAFVLEHFCPQAGRDAVRHLFVVASSLDSMVIGEPQILSQVKQAYQVAVQQSATGPLTHAVFQSAMRVARRVASETSIHHRRVSIPSVAVGDFARQIFQSFDDKRTLVIGAGEMAEETLRYLRNEGARDITVVNRSLPRALDLAQRWNGRVLSWDRLLEALAAADLVLSTTGATEPIVTLEQFLRVEAARGRQPLFIVDLAVPRDFDPRIGQRPGVYLYSVDDLQQACDRNRQERDREMPQALRIIDEETDRFLEDLHRRAIGPVIQQLRHEWEEIKEDELHRLFNKLPGLDEHAQAAIRESFDRLVNKLLHPPMASLRVASRAGIPSMLLDSLRRLFQLKD